MRQKQRARLFLLLAMICFLMGIMGCKEKDAEGVKLRDLEFTVQGEDVIPKQLLDIVEGKKKEPFKLTYSDRENLYICIGYGEQNVAGYSIVVNDLYLTENAIYVSTELLGPKEGKAAAQIKSYPYIVIKTEYLDKNVIFR